MEDRPREGEGDLVMAKFSYIPNKGDAIWITLDPQAGHEQAGRRQALVLSPAAYNRKVDLALVCPITPKGKGYPFEVVVPDGLKVTGVILADQVKSLDWRARKSARIEVLPEEVVKEVLKRLRTLLPGI